MQAVILAAGEGRRMRPLTLDRPKPLVELNGRPLLEYIIDALPREVDEIILVVGYKAEMIKAHFGDSYDGRRIRYVHQQVPEGTAHALGVARPLLTDGRFLLLCADDLHGKKAFEKALLYPLALLAAEHREPSKFGVIEMTADGALMDVIEKPEVPPTNLVWTGAMVLNTCIFQYEAARQANGEYYINDMFRQLAKAYPVQVVTQDFWVPVGCPEDIAGAEEELIRRANEQRSR